jgi:diguanylate cyclase (GGDEF)-like protein
LVVDNQQREKLQQLLKKANVPTLPMVAQKLVELCNDDRADFSDFAQVIQSDPGLASSILRMANSAFYGLRHKATTLERAIGTLGLKHVKTISLGFHLAASLSKFDCGQGFDMSKFWQQNVLRGLMARELANQYCPDRREEAFLIGLLQDCGIPFLVQAWGEVYSRFWGERQNSPSSHFMLEQELFGYNHVKVAETITEKWSLPDLLALPIHKHHRRGPLRSATQDADKLAQIAYFVATLSLDNPERLSKEDLGLMEFSRTVFQIDESDFKKILLDSQKEFRQVAFIFSDLLGENIDITDLICQARDLLIDIESNDQREKFDLEAEVDRLQESYDILSSTVEDSIQEAQKDDLTGLSGRSILDEYLNEACQNTQSGQGSLYLLFIDIDSFKRFNDEFGHGIGDRVIKSIAELLQGIFPEKSCSTRYGGDEFVVALRGLQFKQALMLSQLLLKRIRELTIPVRTTDSVQNLSIRCSVGMLFCEAGAKVGNAQRVLELVDHQMYQAKRKGKNGLCYGLLSASSDQAKTQAMGTNAPANDKTTG